MRSELSTGVPGVTTMRAAVQDRYGDSSVLRTDDIPTPACGPAGVLVRVRAAGLDRGVEHAMTGKPYASRLAFGVRRPRNPVPGRDVAGTVVAVGSAVTRFSPGDDVYGIAAGSFAEYVVGREDKLAAKPGNLSFEQAAVVPVSALTALQALEAGGIEPGHSVLVLGASGGVGSYAVQLAKLSGAHVTGVCGPAKVDLVRSLGADRVLDHTRDDFADGTHYDLVLDIGGNPSLSRLRRALSAEGAAVFVGGEGGGSLTGMGRQLRGAMLSPFLRQRMSMFLTKERAVDLERLTPLLERGELTPHVGATYSLERVADAMRLLAAGEVRGKVAITL